MRKLFKNVNLFLLFLIMSSCSITGTVLDPYNPDVVSDIRPVFGFFTLPGTPLSGNITASVSVYDDNGITNVEFYLDNIFLTNDDQSPYSMNIITTDFSDGGHTIRAVAYDTIGQYTQSTTNVIFNNVGDALPLVNGIFPSSGFSNTVEVLANVSDDHGVTNVSFYVGETLIGNDTSVPFSFYLDTTLFTNGDYSLIAIAYDTIGQTGSRTNSITISNTIDNITQLSSSSVYGNDSGVTYSIDNTVDGNTSSHWITQTLALNDVKWIAYQFSSAVVVNYIELFNDYSQEYALADLEILSSSDSTDGINGTWQSIASVDPADHGFISGEGTVTLNKENITWIKLSMTFNGAGANGGPPSLQLSEIEFYGRIY